MRIEAEEDAAGNLLARLPGRGERSILLCAHLDTVDDGGVPIDPVIVDGGWENANDGILGADNKAAVAVILELARRCSVEGSPVGLELLFTTGEENALEGAKEFDASKLQLRLRLRLRPRDADRRGGHRVADLLPPRRRVPRPGRPRRHPSRGGPLRHPRRRPGHRPHAARPDRRADDRQRRLDPGRRGEHEHRARALQPARRDALARSQPGRGRGVRHRRRHPRRRRLRGVRRRRRLRAPVHRLPAEAERARRSSPPRRRCAPAATSPSASSPAGGRTRTCSRRAASRA